jgi:outer membrane protein OmpA-like peptidoglycan-associated protein
MWIVAAIIGGTELSGQQVTGTLTLYYGINERASEQNNQRIDSLAATLKHKSVSFSIFGYADYLSDNGYNKRLSAERAEAVRDRLAKKVQSPYVTFLACTGKGESNSREKPSAKGDPPQRRVDILYTVRTGSKFVETRPKRVPRDTAAPKKKLGELSTGESVEIEGLSFQPGRHFLMPGSQKALDDLLVTMKENPSIKIEIQGHICCSAGPADGIDIDTGKPELSLNRARAVYSFLVKNGIDRERLKFIGFGRSKPKVDPETTPEEEQMNRRVEILVTER